jgi:hypothetical protein
MTVTSAVAPSSRTSLGSPTRRYSPVEVLLYRRRCQGHGFDLPLSAVGAPPGPTVTTPAAAGWGAGATAWGGSAVGRESAATLTSLAGRCARGGSGRAQKPSPHRPHNFLTRVSPLFNRPAGRNPISERPTGPTQPRNEVAHEPGPGSSAGDAGPAHGGGVPLGPLPPSQGRKSLLVPVPHLRAKTTLLGIEGGGQRPVPSLPAAVDLARAFKSPARRRGPPCPSGATASLARGPGSLRDDNPS